MLRVAISAGLHAVLALALALFWFEPPPEDVSVLLVKPARHRTVRGLDVDRQADGHPPIVPEKFQPDWNAVNDAKAVIVNSTPTNIDAAPELGNSLEASDTVFLGRALTMAVGTGGGAAGRRGSFGACFG